MCLKYAAIKTNDTLHVDQSLLIEPDFVVAVGDGVGAVIRCRVVDGRVEADVISG